MRHLCVVGLQWGDEGKGKIVDVLSAGVDAVVRYQGGANAGHTIYIGDRKHVLHHLPSGILRERNLAVLGNGMVIDPTRLLEEIRLLKPEACQRLFISDRAHVVLPSHTLRDRRREQEATAGRIGTTQRGIGPAYEDKYARRGVRIGDLVRPGYIDGPLRARLVADGVELDVVESFLAVCRQFVGVLGERVTDTAVLLADLDARSQKLLFEGAQGSLLDVEFGTYPYVTSSSPSFFGLGPGTGFSPRRIDHVLGVTKAYCTRVGEGPFPSELIGAAADELRTAGNEFGATTGRPRRCGWLDLVALEHAIAINDVDSLAVTKADVLVGRPTIPVVVGYRLDGRALPRFPAHIEDLARIEPVLEDWPGWADASPAALAPFLARLTARVKVPVAMLSCGRRRDEIVFFPPLDAFLTGAV
ncbi:MAG: adenylosuccinate synthase [Planctomycetota bacterium]